MANIERTLVLVKPDAMKRNLAGLVLDRLAQTKLKLVACKLTKVSPALAEEHYKGLKDKPFFPELIQYIQGKFHGTEAVMAMVYAGPNAIATVRAAAGATNPEEADPTSIRASFGRITTKGMFENVIHASSDPGEGEREIALWFKPEEIVSK